MYQHDDVDSNGRELLQEQQKVYPCKEYPKCSDVRMCLAPSDPHIANKNVIQVRIAVRYGGHTYRPLQYFAQFKVSHPLATDLNQFNTQQDNTKHDHEISAYWKNVAMDRF